MMSESDTSLSSASGDLLSSASSTFSDDEVEEYVVVRPDECSSDESVSMRDRRQTTYERRTPQENEFYHDSPTNEHQMKGQLKLSLYAINGLLTLHVMSGRNLMRSERLCNSFVKVCLMPDITKRTFCETDVICADNNPEFNEKFSFELMDGDFEKRLYISVWNRVNASAKECEFLGCLSFSIRRVYHGQKYVRRYYYLLPAEVGRVKHVRVPPQNHSSGSSRLRESDEKTTGDDLVDSLFPRKIDSARHFNSDSTSLVTVRRRITPGGVGGFGFSISGDTSGRVHVCRLDCTSDAYNSGLRIGDEILELNGRDVTQKRVERIADVIRNSPWQVSICVRHHRSTVVVPKPIVNRVGEPNPTAIPRASPAADVRVHLARRRSVSSTLPKYSQSTAPATAASTAPATLASTRKHRPMSSLVRSASFTTTDYGWLDETGSRRASTSPSSSDPRSPPTLAPGVGRQSSLEGCTAVAGLSTIHELTEIADVTASREVETICEYFGQVIHADRNGISGGRVQHHERVNKVNVENGDPNETRLTGGHGNGPVVCWPTTNCGKIAAATSSQSVGWGRLSERQMTLKSKTSTTSLGTLQRGLADRRSFSLSRLKNKLSFKDFL